MYKTVLSNALLVIGAITLVTFGILEVTGFHADPLMPALSASLIGMTVVLDRGGFRRLR